MINQTKSIDLTWSDVEWLSRAIKFAIMDISSKPEITESVYWGHVELHQKLNKLNQEFNQDYSEVLDEKRGKK